MIRNAQIADMPQILEVGKRLKAKTMYADIPLDVPIFAQTFGQCISSALGFAMVAAERETEWSTKTTVITGFMLGVAQPLWFSKKRSASDLITYAERPGDGYRLIRAFIDWAWSIPGVVEITLAQSSGIDIERSGVLYERAGLTRVGAIYMATREFEIVEDVA